jgi:hypothetical protein
VIPASWDFRAITILKIFIKIIVGYPIDPHRI